MPLNLATRLTKYQMLPDPITVTLTPNDSAGTLGTAVTVTEARSRPLQQRELQMLGSIIGIEDTTRAFLLPINTLGGTVPKNGDTITDNAANDWTIRVAGLDGTDTLYRCVCVKNIPSVVYTDETTDIQALLDAGGDVAIPAGTHLVGALTVPSTVTSIYGVGGEAGTVLRLADNSPDFTRILNILPTGSGTMAIEIYDLTFDMNRDRQSWAGGFDLEHQAAIILRHYDTGFVDADIHDVTIRDSAGDGIYVYHRARPEIQDCTFTDIFRAAVAITGRASVTNFHDSVMTRAGLDVEPNSVNDNVTVTLDELTITDGKFDVGIKPGGSVTASNIHHSGGILYLFVAPTATFYCSDSEFEGRYTIRLPGASTFERCTFTAPSGNEGSHVVGVSWAYHSWDSDQVLTFIDCEFTGPGARAIHANADTLGNNNSLIVTDSAAVDVTTFIYANNTDTRTYTGLTLDGSPWP